MEEPKLKSFRPFLLTNPQNDILQKEQMPEEGIAGLQLYQDLPLLVRILQEKELSQVGLYVLQCACC
jgi:hypothetical protein